jgi:uncharacterized protein with PQ loop repeat
MYFLKYPFVMKNLYGYLNAQLTELMTAIPKDSVPEIKSIRSKNNQNVNLFIYAPMFFGILLNVFVFISSGDLGVQRKYVIYYHRMTLPIKGDTTIRKGINIITRIVKGTIHNPISLGDFKFFIWGYSLSILGAVFLKLNPIFAENNRISDVLKNMKKVDQEGYPWKVLWTPNFIMFEAYGCEPNEFYKDHKFWNTINFHPDQPIPNVGENRNKFIVPKQYKLPDSMEFVYREQKQ